MNEYRSVLERAGSNFARLDLELETILRRRDRKRRNQRIGAAVLAIIITLVSFAAAIRTFEAVENRPADEPTPTPSPTGIFADVGGWIAYTNEPFRGYLYDEAGPHGIWAVDPTRPNDPEARIQLSERPGEPLAWSSDGSKLLIGRRRYEGGTLPIWAGLFVLNADGTERRVATSALPLMIGDANLGFLPGGSFSPDGSRVVVAAGGIYTVDTKDGTVRPVLEGRPRTVFKPAFSPDGTQIAYFALAFSGDRSLSLRVVNADGTGVRVLVDECGTIPLGSGPAWSPDGTRIAFSCHNSFWVVGTDGSGLTKVYPGGVDNPSWSPDGGRIAFELRYPTKPFSWDPLGTLATANADGTHVQKFPRTEARAGPWNPLPLAVGDERSSTETTAEVSRFVYAIAALGVIAAFFLAWRARAQGRSGDSTSGP